MNPTSSVGNYILLDFLYLPMISYILSTICNVLLMLMTYLILSMICYILLMICYASFPRWSAQMARFTTVTKTCESGLELRSTASSRKTKRLQLVSQKKIGAGDAKKPSESSSGDKGSFELWCWRSVDVWNCNSFVSSSNFAVPPCPSVLDTLSWPDNSCSENEM